MRTLTSTITNAIANVDGLKASARVTFYRNHISFVEADIVKTYMMSFAESTGIHPNYPLLQSSYYYASQDKTVTVYNHEGALKLSIVGQVDEVTIPDLNTLVSCKPCIFNDRIYFYNTGQLQWSYATIDVTAMLANPNSAFVDSTTNLGGNNQFGAIYALSSTIVALLYLSEGGVAFHIWRDGSDYDSGDTHRMMFPSIIWETADIPKLSFSGAACLNENVYCYLSSPDGSVLGIEFSANDLWSDVFTAVPHDLTRFFIGNVIQDASGRIHMIGQFDRTDSFDSGVVYNLALWSDSPFIFSIDRYTLFSTTSHPFQMVLTSDQELFLTSNQYVFVDPSWQFFQANAEHIHIDGTRLKPISGGSNSDWSFSIANYDDFYTGHELLVTGSIAKLELGFASTATRGAPGTYEWMDYDLCAISNVADEFADGFRQLTIAITPVGIWRTSVMTYPWYMEIQPKSSVRDDINDLGNLAPDASTEGMPEQFAVDLWDGIGPTQGGGLTAGAHDQNATTVFETPDLVGKIGLTDYPIITVFPIHINVYGWSRIGRPSTNPNTADDTSASSPNDDFLVSMQIKRISNGVETLHTISIDKGLAEKSYPPQYWKTGHSRIDGADPVSYDVDEHDSDLQLNDRIVKITITCSSVERTVAYIERVEIPEVIMYVSRSDTGYEIMGDVDKYLLNKTKGIPNVMYSANPFSAFTFETIGDFSLTGDETWVGLVGLGTDPRNYICARASLTDIEIIKVRQGVETVLATTTWTAPTRFSLMFSHRDGGFSVYTKSSTATDWSAVALTYTWKAADGVMAANNYLFHVGIYTLIDVPFFRITGLDIADAVGIGMMAGYDRTALNDFPSSGQVSIDGIIYAYTGKTAITEEIRGPFQLRNTCIWHYDNPDDSQHYDGTTCEITFFAWRANGTYHDKYAGYLLASDVGFCWPITETDWKAFTITGGATVWLLNRSRFRVDGANDGSLTDKVSVTCGLTGVTLVSGGSSTHSEGVYCYLDDGASETRVYSFFASSGDRDAVMGDMVDMVCRMAGAEAHFPGNKTLANLTLSGTGVEL